MDIEGKIEEILRIFEKLDNTGQNALVYQLSKKLDIEGLVKSNYNGVAKKYNFIGKNYFEKIVLNKNYYAKSEKEIEEHIKHKTDFMFRTKKQLLKIGYGDGVSDEIVEDDISAEVNIHRRYSKCITSHETKEV